MFSMVSKICHAHLRRYVYLIESYCKKHFAGKIPAKQKIQDMLSMCTNDKEVSTLPLQQAHEKCHEKLLIRNMPHLPAVSYHFIDAHQKTNMKRKNSWKWLSSKACLMRRPAVQPQVVYQHLFQLQNYIYLSL